MNQDEFTNRIWDIADGTGNGRHFREQLVSERFGQPLDENLGVAKMRQRRNGDADQQFSLVHPVVIRMNI